MPRSSKHSALKLLPAEPDANALAEASLAKWKSGSKLLREKRRENPRVRVPEAARKKIQGFITNDPFYRSIRDDVIKSGVTKNLSVSTFLSMVKRLCSEFEREFAGSMSHLSSKEHVAHRYAYRILVTRALANELRKEARAATQLNRAEVSLVLRLANYVKGNVTSLSAQYRLYCDLNATSAARVRDRIQKADSLAIACSPGIPVEAACEMVCKPLPENALPVPITRNDMLDFISHLASLRQNRASGVDRLFRYAHGAWAHDMKSGESKCGNFLRIAEVAHHLREHGYRELNVTCQDRCGYEYNIMGVRGSDGKKVAILVRREIDDLVKPPRSRPQGPGYHVPSNEDTLSKFLQFSERDGRTALIALCHVDARKWVESRTHEFVKGVATHYNFAQPTFIHGMTGEVIAGPTGYLARLANRQILGGSGARVGRYAAAPTTSPRVLRA